MAGDVVAMREVFRWAGVDGTAVLAELGRAWAIDITDTGVLTYRQAREIAPDNALPCFSVDTEIEAQRLLDMSTFVMRQHPYRLSEPWAGTLEGLPHISKWLARNYGVVRRRGQGRIAEEIAEHEAKFNSVERRRDAGYLSM